MTVSEFVLFLLSWMRVGPQDVVIRSWATDFILNILINVRLKLEKGVYLTVLLKSTGFIIWTQYCA